MAVAGTPGSAAAQSLPCDAAHAQAEDAYFRADFQEAIRLLSGCAEAADKRAVAVDVYRLRAFAHLGAGDETRARLVVEDLLDVAPAYTPNLDTDRPDFVELVRTVQSSRRPPQTRSSPRRHRWVRWVVAGLSAVALAAVIRTVSGGGDGGGGSNGGDDNLPDDDLPGDDD
jgi:hypothetical protein